VNYRMEKNEVSSRDVFKNSNIPPFMCTNWAKPAIQITKGTIHRFLKRWLWPEHNNSSIIPSYLLTCDDNGSERKQTVISCISSGWIGSGSVSIDQLR
jgi:hypothetical protein